MDEPSSDRDNPAKRRCPNDRESDTLFMSRSPEPTTPKESSNTEGAPDDDEENEDDEDNNDDSGSELGESTYDESQELFPSHPAFDPAIEAVKDQAASSVKRLESLLEQYASVNKDLENMKEKTAEVMKSGCPRRIRVGLLGGTAAGKSALINSLTDCPGLAKELSAGEACTSVPMLYMHELPDQTAPFAAKVSYYPVRECHWWFKWLLSSYNRFFFKFNQEWTDEEKNKYRQEANTALNTLRALFCDKSQFGTQQSTVETLAKNCTQAQRSPLPGTMAKWYEERLHGVSHEDGMPYTFCQGSTVTELRNVLDPLITPKHVCDKPLLWPLVKQVTVGVPSSKILRDLTMVDLPGTTDTNRVRVRATHEHLRQCQALWYIVSVERPCTDPDLEYAVSSYADRFPGKLAVIVTKIDRDVNDALANDMKNKDQDVEDFYDHKKSIKEHNKCLRSVRTKLKRKSCTAGQRNTLRDQEDALMANVEKLEALKFECVVGARNAHISAVLKWEKAQFLPDGAELPVYCVSNRHYAVYKGSAAREGPLLEVNSTGIPDLRAYALALAAPSVWKSHKEILVHRLKVLFHGVHGWAQNSPMRSNRGLPQVVKPVKSLWEAISKASVDHCLQGFSSPIVGKLRAEHATSFAEMMRYFTYLTDKNEWHPCSFLAFFRNNGRHTTKKAGSHIWNEAFIKWQRANVLDPAWDELPNPQDSFDIGIDKLIKSLEDIPEQLNSLPESVPLSTAAFINMLHGQVALIRVKQETLKAEYQDRYGNVKLDAYLDQDGGHFEQAMKPCYRKGRDDMGEGVCARVKKLLSDHLTKNDPLGQATDKLEAAFGNLAKRQATRLRTEVEKILGEVDQQFELILRRESETPEETEARSKINEVLREVMPDIDRIEFDLKAIERKYMGALVQQ